MNATRIMIGFFVAQIICSGVPQTAFSQTEKLGIVHYTPPPGWTKTLKENVVAFSTINQSTGRYCIITVYGATPGSGNPQTDFTREWNNLVVKPFQAVANPQTESQAADGWTIIAGGAAVEFQGLQSLALLTVFSGFGKTISVLGVLNDQSYAANLDAFVSGIKLDKTGPPASPTTNFTNQPGKFGAMSYAAPAGWTHQQFADGVVFKPADLPADETLAIQIMPPLNASGSLEQALAQSYDEAAAMYKSTKMFIAGGGNYQKNDIRKSFNGWEYIRGKGGIQVENGTPYKTELGLELFVVKINNRFERVAIVESRKNCNLSRYYASDRSRYRSAIEGLLFSLQFSDFPAPTMPPGSARGAGIVGVWQGISLAVGATSIGESLGIRYKVFSPIFLTNGQVYFGPKFPSEGLSGFDSRIPAELYRRDWGTYTFSNGRGILKMPYADIPMRLEGNRLIITPNKTDHAFIKLDAVDGATFNGTYALGAVNGKIPAITFSADGRFTDNGALRVLYHEYVDCVNPALAPGSGTYEVKDYTVLFHYADGRKIKIAFMGAEYSKSNPSPATLLMSFNEDKLIRQ